MNTNVKVSKSWVQDHCGSDWVKNDRRSVASYLRGNGDNRVEMYEHFLKMITLKNPTMSIEEKDQAYANFVKSSRMKKNMKQKIVFYFLELSLANLSVRYAPLVQLSLFSLFFTWIENSKL